MNSGTCVCTLGYYSYFLFAINKLRSGPERWRTSQALDYAHILHLCVKTDAKYIIIIEDDIQVSTAAERL